MDISPCIYFSFSVSVNNSMPDIGAVWVEWEPRDVVLAHKGPIFNIQSRRSVEMWTHWRKISRCPMNDDSVFNWEECCCAWAKRFFLRLLGCISSQFHPASPSSGECLLGCLPVLGWWNICLGSGCSPYSALWTESSEWLTQKAVTSFCPLPLCGLKVELGWKRKVGIRDEVTNWGSQL